MVLDSKILETQSFALEKALSTCPYHFFECHMTVKTIWSQLAQLLSLGRSPASTALSGWISSACWLFFVRGGANTFSALHFRNIPTFRPWPCPSRVYEMSEGVLGSEKAFTSCQEWSDVGHLYSPADTARNSDNGLKPSGATALAGTFSCLVGLKRLRLGWVEFEELHMLRSCTTNSRCQGQRPAIWGCYCAGCLTFLP